MEHVTQRAIVQDHNLAQIGLHRAEILDECSLSVCAVLPVIPPREELPLLFEPVDNGVRILLDRRREDDKVEPFAYLSTTSATGLQPPREYL